MNKNSKSLATMAKSDLLDLDPSSILSQSFSRSFLIGFASTILNLCGQNLTDRYNQKIGSGDVAAASTTFDVSYLINDEKWNKTNFVP